VEFRLFNTAFEKVASVQCACRENFCIRFDRNHNLISLSFPEAVATVYLLSLSFSTFSLPSCGTVYAFGHLQPETCGHLNFFGNYLIIVNEFCGAL